MSLTWLFEHCKILYSFVIDTFLHLRCAHWPVSFLFSSTLSVDSPLFPPFDLCSQMKALSYFAFTILCSLSFPPSLLSLQCKETQYGWPEEKPQLCCDMCKPGKMTSSQLDGFHNFDAKTLIWIVSMCISGEYLKKRRDRCQTECAPCEGKRYTNHYNVQLSCEFCKVCNRRE